MSASSARSTCNGRRWAPIFGKIGATVTDVGGMMSHAAIGCREHGLPAVTGTGFGTKRIKTGQRIWVDRNAGVVTVLDSWHQLLLSSADQPAEGPEA